MPTKLFVGNINHTATENDLQDHFAAAGTVVSVNIIQDRMTGRSRGFGFVEMSSAEEAEKAVSLFHEKDFQGRALTVNEARPREDRSGGGGGGGYVGGGGGGGSVGVVEEEGVEGAGTGVAAAEAVVVVDANAGAASVVVAGTSAKSSL